MMRIFETILTELQLDEIQQAQIDSVAKRLGRTPEEIEAWARDADPTPNFKYGTWILKQFRRGTPAAWDQDWRAQLHNALSIFDRAKKSGYLRGDEAAIQSYEAYRDLADKVEEIPEEALVSRRAMKRRKADPLNIPGSQVIRVSKDGNWKVVRVETPEACMFHGKGTNWCTRGSHHADSYTTRGPLYVIYAKTMAYEPGAERPEPVGKWKPFVQYTHDYGEVLDTEDHDVPWDEFDVERRDELLVMMAPEPEHADQQEAYEEYVDMTITGGGVSALARQVAEMDQSILYDSQDYQTNNINAGGSVEPPGLSGNLSDPVVLGNIRAFMKEYGQTTGVQEISRGARPTSPAPKWGSIHIDLDIDDDEMWQRILDLDDYGILDDDAHMVAEHDLIDSAWEDYFQDEFKSQLKKQVEEYEELEDVPAGLWEEAIDGMDGGDLWQLLQDTMEDAQTYWEFNGDSFGIDLDTIIQNIDWSKLRETLALETFEQRRELEAEEQKAREKAAGQQFFPGMENLTPIQYSVYHLLVEQSKKALERVEARGSMKYTSRRDFEKKRLAMVAARKETYENVDKVLRSMNVSGPETSRRSEARYYTLSSGQRIRVNVWIGTGTTFGPELIEWPVPGTGNYYAQIGLKFGDKLKSSVVKKALAMVSKKQSEIRGPDV